MRIREAAASDYCSVFLTSNSEIYSIGKTNPEASEEPDINYVIPSKCWASKKAET